MTYLNESPRETDAAWLCRTKARGCQRAALTTTDHNIRLRYLHLAKLWHEMAREAERKANCSSSSDGKLGSYFPDAVSEAQQCSIGADRPTWAPCRVKGRNSISERDAQHGPAGVVAGLFSASPLCALFPSPRKRLAKPCAA